MDPEIEETAVEAGFGARDPKVAGQRQVHAGSHRRAVHRGDRRQGTPGDGQESLVDGEQALAGRVTQLGQVRPGAERGAVAGDHHRTHLGILHQGLDRAREIRAQLQRQRVAARGVVERHHRHAVPRSIGADLCHCCRLLYLRNP